MYKVFVTEDEAFVREGIRNKLETSEQFVLCGEAQDGEIALSAIQELKPDILIVDIEMPFMNGLELSRIVKRSMPWMGIIIVSAHNEFQYTQKAISIGIDEYLQKPIGAKTLMKSLEIVAEKLENRRKKTDEMSGNSRRNEEKSTLRDHLLGQLTGGLLSTEQFLQLAPDYGIDLVAKHYVVAECEIAYAGQTIYTMHQRRQQIEALLGMRDDIVWFFKGPERLLMIVKSEDSEASREAVYEAAQTIKYGMKRDFNANLTIGIGTIVTRIGQIKDSLEGAHTAMHFLLSIGQPGIVGIDDLKEGNSVRQIAPAGNMIDKRLRYAVEDDFPGIVQEFLSPYHDGEVTSMLFGYYRLMELVMSAALVIRENGADPQDILGEYMSPDVVLKASASLEQTETAARQIICRTVESKRLEGQSKYDDVLLRVKDYINKNYSDSSLSLGVIASFAGFSPNHFSTLFSSQTGSTFIEYLTHVRMENAKKMLQSNLKIADIAYNVGYRDTRYFNFSFKKSVGCSPREYRERNAKVTAEYDASL